MKSKIKTVKKILAGVLAVAMVTAVMPAWSGGRLDGIGVLADAESDIGVGSAWKVGDNINLGGKWFDHDDDNLYEQSQSADESVTIPAPTYMKDYEQWVFVDTIKTADGGYENLYLSIPQGSYSSDKPTGFKIKSGTGEQEDPYVFELVYDSTSAAFAEEPEANTLTYNGSVQELVTKGTAVGGTIQYSLGDSGQYFDSVPTAVNAGTYTVHCKVIGDAFHTDSGEKLITVTIAQATVSLSVPVEANELTYTGEPQTLVKPGQANVGTVQYSLNKNGEYSAAVPAATNAGYYTVYYRVSVDGDNVSGGITEGSVEAKIRRKDISNAVITLNKDDFTYDKTLHTVEIQDVKLGDTTLREGVDYEIGTTSDKSTTEATNKGTYTLEIEGIGNYKGTVSKEWKIVKLASTVTKAPKAKELTYNGSYQDLVEAGEATGGTIQYRLVETSWYEPRIPEARDAGEYTVYYKVKGDETHEDGEEGSLTVTIKKADSVITTPPTAVDNLIYNRGIKELVTKGTAHGGTIQYKLGENGTYSTNIPTAINAGDYKVYYKVLGNANYNNIAENSVDVTIAKCPVEVEADSRGKTFGDPDPELTYTYDAIYYGDQLTGELSRVAGEDAGEYDITQGTLANDNYEITFVGAKLKISKRNINRAQITLESNELQYTGNELSPNITEVKVGNKILIEDTDYEIDESSSANGTKRGEYTLKITGKGNYTGTAQQQWRIVTKLPTVVTTPSASAIQYGQTLGDSEISGAMDIPGTFTWEDETIVPTVADSGKTEYEVIFTPDDANYDPVTVMVTVTVTPVDIEDAQISLQSDEFVYTGSELSPKITKVMLGDKELETDDYELDSASGTKGTNHDEYTLKIKGIGNYIGEASKTWHITKASPVVNTPPAASAITYGQKLANSTLNDGTADTAGSFTWTDSTIALTVADSNKTEYEVTFTPNDTENYDPVTVKVKVTVNKAPVTVTAAAKTKTYGEADPELTYASEGLLSGDTLTGALSRDKGERVGEYNINQGTLKAGDNYEIIFEGAKLKINPKSITGAQITLDSNELVYTGDELSPNITKVMLGQTELTDDDYIIAEDSDISAADYGTYTLTINGRGNYTGAVSTEWKIAKGIIVTYNSQTGTAQIKSDEAIDNADLIFAEYDSEHRLVSAEVKHVSVEADGEANENYTVKSSANTLKVMLWNSLNEMEPLKFAYKEVGRSE